MHLATADQSQNKSKLVPIQYLRAIAAVSVVFFHAGGVLSQEKYQDNHAIAYFVDGLDAGVDLFFVISGFVLSIAVVGGGKKRFSTFMFGRVLRIYPMSILTTAIFALSGLVVLGTALDLNQLLTSVLLLPSPEKPIPVVLWTLKQEMLFYLVLATALVWRRVGLGVFCSWAILSFIIGSNLQEGQWFLKWLFNSKNIEFLAGLLAYVAWKNINIQARTACYLFIVSLVAFLGFSLSASALALDPSMNVIAYSIICGVLVYSAASATLPYSRSLLFLGEASYSIYLIHFFFLSLGNKLAVKLPFPDLLTFLIISLVSIGLGGVYYYSFEKRFEKMRVHLLLRGKKTDSASASNEQMQEVRP